MVSVTQATAPVRSSRRPAHGRDWGGSPTGDPSVALAVSGRHLPALDGLRAIAVAGVFTYHLGVGWAQGGYFGVDIFFVLSGFLITSLLLEEWARTAAIKLGAFWARRARRLLPALLLVLCAIGLFVVLNGRFGGSTAAAQVNLSEVRGDALAALFYVANWHAIFAHQSYFAQFAAPSPLQHTWTLAIEEQFYLVWPPVLLLLLTRFRNRWRPVGAAVTVTGALASGIAMALLYHPGLDPSRVYYGTDTRSFGILAGAALAMATAAKRQPGPRTQRALHVLGPVAAVALGVIWANDGTPEGLPRSFMFHGGFLVAVGLTVLVVADIRQVHLGPLGRLLALSPLVWLGRISYGLYLWHWPVIVYLNPQRTGIDGAGLDLLRVAVTILLAAASYYLVEMPIRRRTFARHLRVALAPACVVATAAIIVVATTPAVVVPAQQAASATPARGVSVPGAGGFEGQVPITLAGADPVSSTHPLRVLLIGDSELFVAYPGMAAAFGATGDATVSDRAYPGWGLSRFDWRTEIPTMISQLHPQVIVAGWTWDDTQALREPKRYRDELEGAVRLMLAPGDGVRGVVFSQLPPSGPYDTGVGGDPAEATAQRTAGEEAFERLARSLPAEFPGKVMYLPVASSVLRDGRFTSWLPPADAPHTPRSEWQRVRMVDNVHLCPAGVVRYADALLSDFVELFHLSAAAPGWWNGTWTSDPRFYTPAGSCPDDHPPG